MYESPIQITQIGEHISTELSEQEEEYIFSVVKRLYVDVDRDELIKALAYDRGQYDKGYLDGRAARDAEIVRCKDCEYHDDEKPGMVYCYCPDRSCGWISEDFFCAYGKRRDNV